MATFSLYHYSLMRVKGEESLPFKESDKISEKNFQDVFEMLFTTKDGSLDIYQCAMEGRGKNRKEIHVPHNSEVLNHKDHIIAFRIQLNKKKRIETEDWQVKNEGHFPDTIVLIDNRPESRIMAIQKTTDADMEKVYKLLKENFTRKLSCYNIAFDCVPLLKHKDFWDSVNEIRERFHDIVRRVSFDFIGKKTKAPKTFVDNLLAFINSIDGQANFAIEKLNDEKLHRIEKDLTQMAILCKHNNNYALTVKFENFGLYRYGQDIKAQWGIDDDLVNDYTIKNQQLELFKKQGVEEKMAKWFDQIKVLFEDYIHDDNEQENPLSIESYILNREKKTEIMDILRSTIIRHNSPQKVLRPLRAAIDAGCIEKPNKDVFEHEYHVTISSASWKRYTGGTIHPYDNDITYQSLLEQFKKIA